MAVASEAVGAVLWKRGVVVVGGGPAGVRCAERLGRAPGGPAVLLLCDERFAPYDRVRLSSLLTRELSAAALDEMPRLARCERVTVLTGRRVVAIDRAERLVRDRHGGEYRYEQLVLATGSRARVPPIPGVELPGVFVFRDLADAERLLARQVGSRATVVIGGGLLGLEAARGMLRFGTRVTVIEHEPRLLFNQLDDGAAARLRARIEALGIDVRVASGVQQIVGTRGPQAVRLRGGDEIECDTVVVATGIAPNIELARDAGIAVGRGIRVDDRMRTADPYVYAIGECAEHRERLYGLVAPGLEQAAVAAANILGEPAEYGGSLIASSLKIAGCPVFSMGEVQPSVTRYRSHVFADATRYRRLNVRAGRVVGAVGFGDWDVARLRAAGLSGRRLLPWQLLRFRLTGEPWPAAAAQRVCAWPAGTTVCNCRGVTRGALGDAMAEGAASVEALSARTGAGTVCGSCKPLLADLVGVVARARVPRALLAFSVVGLLLALSAYAISIPYRDTVQVEWRYDRLWTDPAWRQASGFTLLALALAASLVSLRKRIAVLAFGRFPIWQLAHVALGPLLALVLALHTGLRFGANLDRWLMATFTALLVAGALSGAALALAPRLAPARARLLRGAALWAHLLLLWPFPVLLGFHVFKGYYF